jgi:putative transposase
MRPRKRRFGPGFAATLATANVPRVWAFDEGRFGLRVGLRQCWCPRGVRPPWVVHDRYEWLWLYAAVEPATGQSLFLLLPRVTKEWLACFLETFAAAIGTERVGLVLDGAGSHRADIPWPERVVPLPLPRYRPELNPAEQVFRVLRPQLANRIFATLAELEAAITAPLQPFWDHPALVQQLTGYPWWTTAVTTMSQTR